MKAGKLVRPALVRALALTLIAGLVVALGALWGARVTALDQRIERGRRRLEEGRTVAAETEKLRHQVAEILGARPEAAGVPYALGEMDTYRFGEVVRDLAGETGLRVERFQPVRAGEEEMVELTVSGSAAALVVFLSRAAAQGRPWKLPHLDVQGSRDAVTAVMRLGYAIASAPAP